LAKTPEQHVWLAKDWPILFHSLHGRTGCGKTQKIGEYAEEYPAGARAIPQFMYPCWHRTGGHFLEENAT
jgi:hypothetical protein